MSKFALSGALIGAAVLAGCSAEGVNTPAPELTEAHFKAACVEEIGAEILSPATMEVVDWEFDKVPITEEMIAKVRDDLEQPAETENAGDMARRILARDNLNKYDNAVASGIEPVTYRATLSFDSLNAVGVPIRADAVCLYADFGPDIAPSVRAEVYPR